MHVLKLITSVNTVLLQWFPVCCLLCLPQGWSIEFVSQHGESLTIFLLLLLLILLKILMKCKFQVNPVLNVDIIVKMHWF